ncbi:MAG: hypothetical protein MJ066_05545 [Clostridia bacterium]|nr:hypothetical protein [Clostridia bacterium]
MFPLIGTARFEQISIFDCNAILREIRAQGHERTAEDVHNLLDQIFSYAELDGLRKNPMKRIKFVRHERKNGRCLTFQEEKTLIEISWGTTYYRAVVLMLYCGLRLCECASAKVYDEDDRFIWALNSKRSKAHNKFTFKLIPITPMMKPYVELIHCTQEVQAHSIGNFISEKMGNGITSRFLRHTFNTRLAKFMIAPEFREFAMGHVSSSVNADTYTHYLEIKDTYFSEFQRVDYALELSPTSSPT